MGRLVVGYLGAPDMLDGDQQATEQSPRSRKPLTDLVFGDTWNAPAPIVENDDAA